MNAAAPFLLLVLFLSGLLMGCNRSPPEPVNRAPPAETKFVAIARGKVDVDGGIARVASPREGVVSRVDVKVGDVVHVGDPLFALDVTQAQMTADAAKADLNAADAQVRLLKAKVDAAKQRASRAQQAASAGAGSDQTADDARQAATELSAEIAVAQAAAESAKQKVRQAEYEIAVRTVRASVAGTVVARNLRVGDAVAPSVADLMEILPAAPKIVRAELNESFVGKVATGMSAEVRSEANPDKTYPARVTRIGEVFGPSKLIENAQESTDARDVECILELGEASLRVGERVQVRIVDTQH